MTVVALQRAPFLPLEVEESWDASLLKQAAELIGYRPQALVEAEQTRKRSLDGNILARALERADIQPFTVASVQAYKTHMIRLAHRGESSRLTRYMHQSGQHRMEKGQTVVHALGWPAWGSLIVTSALSACLHFGGYLAGWGWDEKLHKSIEIIKYMSLDSAAHLVALPVAAVGVWAALMCLRYKKANTILAHWAVQQVQTNPGYNDGYKAPIPAFAVARMLSLKKELPEVIFAIEQLNAERQDLNTQHRQPLPPDPFLIATFRGISAYVDVWDEPRFEGRRTV